jgi:hypothetical protein
LAMCIESLRYQALTPTGLPTSVAIDDFQLRSDAPPAVFSPLAAWSSRSTIRRGLARKDSENVRRLARR